MFGYMGILSIQRVSFLPCFFFLKVYHKHFVNYFLFYLWIFFLGWCPHLTEDLLLVGWGNHIQFWVGMETQDGCIKRTTWPACSHSDLSFLSEVTLYCKVSFVIFLFLNFKMDQFQKMELLFCKASTKFCSILL